MRTYKIRNSIVLIISALVITLVVVFSYSEIWFPSIWGCHSLGGNFYALDWDGGNQIVVYCANPHGKTIYGGAPIIGKENTDCIEVKYNDQYIAMIAHDLCGHELDYYIFDKQCVAGLPEDSVTSSVLRKGLVEMADSLQYNQLCTKYKINKK